MLSLDLNLFRTKVSRIQTLRWCCLKIKVSLTPLWCLFYKLSSVCCRLDTDSCEGLHTASQMSGWSACCVFPFKPDMPYQLLFPCEWFYRAQLNQKQVPGFWLIGSADSSVLLQLLSPRSDKHMHAFD